MKMVRCNAMSALVDEESATAAPASAGVTTTTYMSMPMVRCNAMSWTDETEGLLKVLVTRRDLVTGAVTVTDEQAVPRAHFTGTVAEKRFMERKWCEKLRQAMSRVEKRRHRKGRGARRQTPVQEGRAADGGAAHQGARLERVRPPARGFGDAQGGAGRGVPERGARAREEQGRETWLECLLKGIRESERLAVHLRRWGSAAPRRASSWWSGRQSTRTRSRRTMRSEKKLQGGFDAQAISAAEQQAHGGVAGVAIAKREGDARGRAPSPCSCCGME
jgi:hypothetical protein